jgi:hypothetical protein
MQRATLSPTTLQNLKPPAAGILELHDPQCRGLVLRVFPTGRATWTLRYRPAGSKGQRRMRLGEYPAVGLAKVRRRRMRRPGSGAPHGPHSLREAAMRAARPTGE